MAFPGTEGPLLAGSNRLVRDWGTNMQSDAAPQSAVLAGESGEVTAAMLRETFDHWRVFEKDGRWWAMRAGAVAGEGPRSLIRPVVCAMTLRGLAEQLSLQEWLRRMSAAELEAVWRDGLAAVAGDSGRRGPKRDGAPASRPSSG